jgi:hypothetical protein
MSVITTALAQALRDIEPFSRLILKRPLRPYQLEPARAVIASVIRRDGEHYVWRFPRQSGKNETLAHVHAYLLFLYQRVAGSRIVHTAPTYDPQAHNAQQRLLELTAGNPFFKGLRSAGHTARLGQAHIVFLSGQPREPPNVGSTASLLLSKDECQDLDRRYIEQTFDPMTANTNAPHIHTGTARHDGTYLALKRQELEALQQRDGKRRVFIIGWREVAAAHPAYGRMVEQVIARKGALHPTVRSEYENIEDAQTGRLFDARRLGLIFTAGTPPRSSAPAPGMTCIITLDVGGADLLSEHSGEQTHARDHDFTVAAVHQVTWSQDTGVNGAALNTFTTLDYLALQGANVLDDTPERRRLLAYVAQWSPARIIPDATGLGVGLAATLLSRFGERVRPFHFSAQSKTALLHEWLALIETGRYRHYSAPGNGRADVDYERLREQLQRCEHAERVGHTQWGVPAHVTWRNPVTQQDEGLHDDHLMAAALCAVAADADLRPREANSIAAARDVWIDD